MPSITEEFLGKRRETQAYNIKKEEQEIKEDEAIQAEEDAVKEKQGKDIMSGTIDTVTGVLDGVYGGSGAFTSAGKGINRLNNTFFDWTKKSIQNARTKRQANYQQAASHALYDKLIAANWSDREIIKLYEIGGETLSSENIGQIVARMKHAGFNDERVENVREALQTVSDGD